MSVIDINWNPSGRQLRQFGLIALIGLPLLGWVFSGAPRPSTWEPRHTTVLAVLGGVGLLLAALGCLQPRILKPVFITATVVAFPIGMVLSEVLLFLVYIIAFVPANFVFRVVGYDPLERNFDREATTYWKAKEQPKDVASYYRQS